MGLLRTILILIGIYLLYKFVFRLLFPLIMRQFIKKAQRDMESRMQDRDLDEEEVGTITIKKKGDKKKSSSQKPADDEEYVDFEEIEDD